VPVEELITVLHCLMAPMDLSRVYLFMMISALYFCFQWQIAGLW